jgi:ketosteroid isomerase-like protein
MAIKESDFAAWLRRYGAAWEARDPEAVMAIFTADATYRETPFDAPMAGRSAIGDYWRARAVNEQRNVKFGFAVLAVSGDTGYAHWTSEFDVPAMGHRLALDGIFRCSFRDSGADSGLCYRLEEWWHLKDLGPVAPVSA